MNGILREERAFLGGDVDYAHWLPRRDGSLPHTHSPPTRLFYKVSPLPHLGGRWTLGPKAFLKDPKKEAILPPPPSHRYLKLNINPTTAPNPLHQNLD